MKKFNYKKIILTCFLLFLTVLIFYGFIGVFISGPVFKQAAKEQKLETTIRKQNKACEIVERYSFKYVTYTCETEDAYVIYDKNGEKIIERTKAELQFDKVYEISSKYPEFDGMEPSITYGYDEMVYLFEKGAVFLVLDFDSLDLLFYSGGN